MSPVRKNYNTYHTPNAARQYSNNTNFYISYNPYTCETIFRYKEKDVKGRFEIWSTQHRLQEFLGPRDNWKGLFPEIVDFCNDLPKVTFKGREIDYEDVQLALQDSEYIGKIQLEYIEAQDDEDIFEKLESFVDDLKDTEIGEIRENYGSIKKAVDAAKDSKLKVSVIATMSSGKSTLINALLGTELLPSKNEACTATVARILDNDDMDTFNCVCKSLDGKVIVSQENVTNTDLTRFNEQGAKMENNDPNKIVFLDLEGPVPGIESKKMHLYLQDTPGPNNSRDHKHKELTDDMIEDKNNSIILYVMNATQLRVNDDYHLLRMVADAMSRGGKETRDRFIFVINKFDDIDLEKEDADKTIQATKDYLKEFGIYQPNIFPVSARAALLLRKENRGETMSRAERQDLNGYKFNFADSDFTPAHFEKKASLSLSVKRKLEMQLKNANEYERALIHTGIPAIEETINEYLEKYAYPMKINDAVFELRGIINEEEMREKFKNKIKNDETSRNGIQAQVDEAERKLEEANSQKEEFRNKLSHFQLDISRQIEFKLQCRKKADKISIDYEGRTKVPVKQANALIHEFQEKIKKIQEDLETDLRCELSENLQKQGDKMLAEYAKTVQQIFKEIQIDGFDFRTVRSINQYCVSSIEKLIQNNTFTEYHTESYEVKNTDKKWYKPWTWFEPKYYTQERKVSDGDFTNIRDIVIKEIGSLQIALNENIDSAYEDAQNRVKLYKVSFNAYFDNLSVEMKKTLNEIRKDMDTIQLYDMHIQETKNKMAEITKVKNNLEAVIS